MGGCFRQLKQVCLNHRFSTGGDFQAGVVGQHLETFLIVRLGKYCWYFSDQRLGVLLRHSKHTDQPPTTKNDRVQNVSSVRLKTLTTRQVLSMFPSWLSAIHLRILSLTHNVSKALSDCFPRALPKVSKHETFFFGNFHKANFMVMANPQSICRFLYYSSYPKNNLFG